MSSLESTILAGVLPNFTGRLETLTIQGITADNFKDPALRVLFRAIDSFYDDHLSIISRQMLKERVSRKYSAEYSFGILEVYDHLCKITVDEPDFREAIKLLKDDDRAILTAAAKAEEASTLLLRLGGRISSDHLDEAPDDAALAA